MDAAAKTRVAKIAREVLDDTRPDITSRTPYPLIHFARFLQDRGMARSTSGLYVSCVRRGLRALAGTTTPDGGAAALQRLLAQVPLSIYRPLLTAWGYFVAYTAECGETYPRLIPAKTGTGRDLEALRVNLVPLMRASKLTPREVHRATLADLLPNNQSGLWYVRSARGREDFVWKVIPATAMQYLRGLMAWAYPRGKPEDKTLPLVPSAVGAREALSIVRIRSLLAAAEREAHLPPSSSPSGKMD
jgi:hypothetical protein